MTPSANRNRFLLGTAVLLLSGVVLAGYAFVTGRPTEQEQSALTSPVLDSHENKSITIGARVKLEEELRALGKERVASGQLSDYSIYFRELIAGPVIAIQETRGFFPASLLKLPVALWYFKHAETNPGLLLEQIEYTGPPGVSVEHFPPARTIVPGTVYTVEELIEYMLAESDNDATSVLVGYAGGREAINEVYRDLDIDTVENYDAYVMDTHTYAAFFRVLFNAEYLDQKTSEHLLDILSRTSFTEGLDAGIPDDVLLSHKFGERTIDVAADINQLHDCGIVYVPQNPYLICMMTQGRDYEEMATFIQDVSGRIYRAAAAAGS